MRTIVAAMLFAAVMVSGATAAHAEATDPRGMEQEFVSLVNDLRASKGLAPLFIHAELVEKGRSWSATMADDGDIWHSHLPDGISAPWRRLGENVGKGGSVGALHDALVASPSHYANLVDAGFTHLGVGVVIDANGSIFVSQEFMELEPVAAAAPAGVAEAPSTTSSGGGSDHPQPPAPVRPPRPPAVGGHDTGHDTGHSPGPPTASADVSSGGPAAPAADRLPEPEGRLTTALTDALGTTGAHDLGLAATAPLLAAAWGLHRVATRRVEHLAVG